MIHQHSKEGFGKTLNDAILLSWIIITMGGVFMTFTHRVPFFLPSVVAFSYGMLAPYQTDTDTNVEPVVVAWGPNGTSTILPIDTYFPGLRGERNSRMRIEKMNQEPLRMAREYEPILSQILMHEQERGHYFVRLQLFWEEWQRSPRGYDALRMQSKRYYITQIQ